MSYYVKRTKVRDTSAAHAQLGFPADTGKVGYSRNFATQAEAQREADAWSNAGEYARHGASDWSAEVLPGARCLACSELISERPGEIADYCGKCATVSECDECGANAGKRCSAWCPAGGAGRAPHLQPA